MKTVTNHNTIDQENQVTKRFQDLYNALRETENRICSDEELSSLPEVDTRHMYHEEWMIRRSSFERLRKYLAHKKGPLQMLEVGCGNGWLSNGLSMISNSMVTGIDINALEIEQAKRVFKNRDNLSFILGDIRSAGILHSSVDIIIFAASIQYFSKPDEVLVPAFDLLRPDGEIHIMDTKFYKPAEVVKAKERSAFYFQSLGFDEMCQAYFHHDINSLEKYNYRIMYDPNHLFNIILKRKDPFHWIMIKNK